MLGQFKARGGDATAARSRLESARPGVVRTKPITTWLLRYCVPVAARTRCGMNTASTDLPRHLGVLREKLQHPTDYEKAVFYFLEEFAGDAGFVTGSVPRGAPHLITILQHVAKKALGETR
jgi:hypothetical protein